MPFRWQFHEFPAGPQYGFHSAPRILLVLPNPVPWIRRLDRPQQILMAVWLLSLVAVMPGVGVVLSLMGFGWKTVVIGATATPVGLTLTLGWSLGNSGCWRRLAPTALIGTAALAIEYGATMFATAPAGSATDTATAAGLVVFGVPATAGLALLLSVGASSALLIRRIHRGPAATTLPGRPDLI